MLKPCPTALHSKNTWFGNTPLPLAGPPMMSPMCITYIIHHGLRKITMLVFIFVPLEQAVLHVYDTFVPRIMNQHIH